MNPAWLGSLGGAGDCEWGDGTAIPWEGRSRGQPDIARRVIRRRRTREPFELSPESQSSQRRIRRDIQRERSLHMARTLTSVTSLTPSCGPELLLTKYQRLSQLVRYTAFLEDATSALVRGPKKEGVQKRRLGRNPRIPFSSHQIALLEHKFRHKQYLSSYDVTELASLLCLSQTRVKIWFQNRRARERRDHESRSRPALPTVPSLPSATALPSVLSSARSAFHPVLGAGMVTSPGVTTEGGLDAECGLGFDTGPEELSPL